MSDAALESALKFVLRWEGGFVDHPNDPGGRTNKGVTQKVYDGWRARQGLARQDVKLIDDTEVHTIYATDYWLPPRCDRLDIPLDTVQFDTAVNMGNGRAIKFLQQAVGAVPVDGRYGPGTQSCVAGCDTGEALVAYCNAREAYYRDLAVRNPKLAVFLKGWINRLNALRKQVGLPGFEAASDEVDYGGVDYMARVPEEEADADK